MPTENTDLASRFLLAFNAIDEHLRHETQLHEREVSFKRVLDEYAARRRGWRHERDLRRCIGLRNVLVHDQVRPGQPPAVPALNTTELIERIRDGLVNPQRVLPAFQCSVTTLLSSERLDQLLTRIRTSDFSQFPVIESNAFVGLVTENGLTRWLARHVSTASLLDLAEHSVADVLGCEEARDNFRFVPRSMLLEDLIEAFREQPSLEAVLVTERGGRSTSFLGIATRWDIVQVLRS